MSPDEFKEYKAVIQGALDFVKFGDRVDIISANDAIYIVSQRNHDIAVLVTPRGSEFNIMYFNCGTLPNADILNLATPGSVQILGELLRAHLKVKYG